MNKVVRLALMMMLAAGAADGATSIRMGGALYPRLVADELGSAFELMGAEGNLTANVTNETRDIVSAFIQIRAGGARSGWTSGFHFGQAYALLPLGVSLPIIKVGQAVIPFGLLAEYDLDAQIVQTPYARTLGLRLDPGFGVEAELGQIDCRLWLSNGNGPDRADIDGGNVVTARVASGRRLGDADARFGLSALVGTLPYWSLDSLDEMEKGPRFFANKGRIGLDNTTRWGPLTVRAEGTVGKDSAWSLPTVFGYYVETRYIFHHWVEPMLVYDGFHTGDGSARTLSAGVNFHPPKITAFEIQTAYQKYYLNTSTRSLQDWQIVAQVAIRF